MPNKANLGFPSPRQGSSSRSCDRDRCAVSSYYSRGLDRGSPPAEVRSEATSRGEAPKIHEALAPSCWLKGRSGSYVTTPETVTVTTPETVTTTVPEDGGVPKSTNVSRNMAGRASVTEYFQTTTPPNARRDLRRAGRRLRAPFRSHRPQQRSHNACQLHTHERL